MQQEEAFRRIHWQSQQDNQRLQLPHPPNHDRRRRRSTAWTGGDGDTSRRRRSVISRVGASLRSLRGDRNNNSSSNNNDVDTISIKFSEDTSCVVQDVALAATAAAAARGEAATAASNGEVNLTKSVRHFDGLFGNYTCMH